MNVRREELEKQALAYWEGILGKNYPRCKCIWKSHCTAPAWKDGWCDACYFSHREGT